MSVISLEVKMETYLDEDGHVVSAVHAPTWFSEDALCSEIKSIYAMIHEAVDVCADNDGIVRDPDALGWLYSISAELKEALELIHERIDDGVYLDDSD